MSALLFGRGGEFLFVMEERRAGGIGLGWMGYAARRGCALREG